MAERVLLINTIRPALFSRLDFHDGRQLATLSIVAATHFFVASPALAVCDRKRIDFAGEEIEQCYLSFQVPMDQGD